MTDWIEWKGGDCPVGDEEMVDVMFKNGVVTHNSCGWDWKEEGAYSIIAYRITEEAV